MRLSKMFRRGKTGLWTGPIVIILSFAGLYVPLSSAASPYFFCADGSRIAVSDVCNGPSHCPDVSDESGKLCWRILCPAGTYRCAYGACVPRSARCNGTEECADGSDEFYCEENQREICSVNEYRCRSNQCVPLSGLCNGYADCLDGSDEREEICRDYICPSEAYRCTYGGCVYRDVLCDGVKDCADGSDEEASLCTNSTEYACREEEFRCNGSGGRCVDRYRVCDGARDCEDAADESEELCKSRGCPAGWFRCAYGACVRSESVCNRKADCYDWSDEEEELCRVSTLPGGACRLPHPKPATRYLVSGASSGCPVSGGCRPGRVVPEHTRLVYACDIGQPLEGSSVVYCQNNRWVPSLPICPPAGNESRGVSCPPVSAGTHRAVARCQVKWGPHQGWFSCDQAQPVGTHLSLECLPFYQPYRGSSSATCLRDGTWNREPLSCRAVCGERESSAAALIVNGWPSTPIDGLPWQATLYSHEDGQWQFFCGGTLIAERVILTAAHCVWKTQAETIKVALGILSQEFEKAIGEDWAQLLDVEKIVLQDSYQDYEGNYGSDLALLILKRVAFINSRVLPACLGVASSSQETLAVAQQHGQVGLISGMGLTENDTFSAFLRVASMKIISDAECRATQSKDFKKYLTYTSFCAGWTNGTSACNGDSGGGLVLRKPNTTVWEVHGVVSISPRRLGTSFCDPTYFTVFTKVSSYGEWIRKVIEDIPSTTDMFAVGKTPNRDNVRLNVYKSFSSSHRGFSTNL